MGPRLDAGAADMGSDAPARGDTAVDRPPGIVDAVVLVDLAVRTDATTGADGAVSRDLATPDAEKEEARDGAAFARDTRTLADAAPGSIDGYLAGGGCKCDMGRNATGTSALWGLAGVMGLALAVRRRRSRIP